MKKYKMIISDFDGTLANDEGTISEENAEAIKKYVESGGIFAICTGRMMNSIYPHAKKLGLDSLLVAYQGAQILDLKSEKFVRDEHLSNNEAVEICREMEKLDLHIHAYDGNDFYTNKVNELLRFYEKVCKVKGKVVNGRLSEFIQANNLQPQKVIALVMPEERESVLKKLTDKLSSKYYITASASILIEASRFGCEKSEGVKFLSQHYGIPLGSIITIGDNLNDITMIKTAGLGVAVANAEPELKEAANYVCEFTNNENAVSHIINKYGLGEEQ